MKMVSNEFSERYHELADKYQAVFDLLVTMKEESQDHPKTVELCNDLIKEFDEVHLHFDSLVLRTEITDLITNKTHNIYAWDYPRKKQYLDNR